MKVFRTLQEPQELLAKNISTVRSNGPLLMPSFSTKREGVIYKARALGSCWRMSRFVKDWIPNIPLAMEGVGENENK